MDANNTRFGLIILLLISAILVGCSISFSSGSNYDHEYSDRLLNSMKQIAKESEQKIKNEYPENIRNKVNTKTLIFLTRHFEKADEMVKRHVSNYVGELPFFLSQDMDRRKELLQQTLDLNANLLVVNSEIAFAISYPNGTVVISSTLAYLFDHTETKFNDALLGVLTHELLHIRDGHSTLQWVTVDGRKDLLIEKSKSIVSSLVSVLPGISIERNHNYSSEFTSSPYFNVLSEYSADLGVLSILHREGFDYLPYVSFLAEANIIVTPTKKSKQEPFSWLSERLECIKESYSNNNEKNAAAGIAAVKINSSIFTACAIDNITKSNQGLSVDAEISELDMSLFNQYR